MIKKILIPCVFITLIGCGQKNAYKVQIMHTAQSGIFVQSETKKIFIDALFKSHPKWSYPAPPGGMLDSMEQALP
ncbi:MAG: hypothetical protein MI922_14500, partial [Bacteroidales bacterium]|nr:hypothetical protein [Bacteroidales bacterium]